MSPISLMNQTHVACDRPAVSRILSRLLMPAAAAILVAMAIPAALAQTGAQAGSPTSNIFSPAPATPQVLCQPQVIGNRRIPKESVLARLFSRQGDPYDQPTVERDFNSLWNTGYFENVRIERVDSPACIQLIVYVREKPTIREINYKGLNAVSLSDVQERFKKAKVGLTVESQYDPTRIKRAENTLKDLLSEHGHQFATIKTEVKDIPPAAVALTFTIKEGPTVKVGKIAFQGNNSLNDRTLRAAMKNLKPIGIPHSIILENLFAKTFDASKLDEDTERVRFAYRDRGYFKAQPSEPVTKVRDAGGLNFFTLRPSTGKRIDILIPLEEGQRYRLGGITFTGNKAVPNTRVLRAQFTQKDGEWFNATMFGKGVDQLRKAYGELGYINMVGSPVPRFDEAKKLIFLDIDIDEGKPFYVSRIEFTGNTITRDKVIRRELLLEEGQVYNSRLWDLSILRLNQLNYFDTLKADQDSESRQNADDGTVDLLLKLKEKGKNSIGLNGGLSGLSGSFIGLNYQTNNFLGLGETLSVNANIGDLSRQLSFGFTEPYLRNKPISVGLQVFSSKRDFNPSKSYGATGSQSTNLTQAQQSQLQNYNESQTGLTLSASEPLRHLFSRSGVARVGVSYSLSRSNITTFNDNTRNVFQSLSFRSGIQGQNQLNGIITSVITPSFTFSTLDRAVGPHNGKDFNLAVQVAGAGGNIKYFQPVASYRQFFPMKGLRVNREGHNVLAYRIQLAHVEGFGGEVAPPFNRIYGGGENDVRGFDIRAASPYTFIPNRVLFTLTNPDGNPVPRDPTNPTLGNVQIPLPVYRLVAIGGDTSFTSNVEYRIPIVNQATFAFFTDFGLVGDALKSQLRESVSGSDAVTSASYGCPEIVNGACSGGTTLVNQTVNGVKYGFNPAPLDHLQTVAHTNFVPRMSSGAYLSVVLPIVNAPFTIYYAYNPLRLYENLPQKLAVPNTCSATVTQCFQKFFPNDGAGQYSYQQALQFYGADYQLREPRKTFRLTVSTTF
ncbi:outer membrane protein insertion porin family [Granulicella aggregans]|uniref:Outer membrane protein assembly factor BamA n=1 Tax=Granulicella aggregans TaxID=474949 RepID=A0A7W8E2N9_9BACT|nr:outer membrane protein assembly factor BamA [Granulicella aggregans]MBB5057093.1 outer membrane protein insertion porin family [Granulicella aggregans]